MINKENIKAKLKEVDFVRSQLRAMIHKYDSVILKNIAEAGPKTVIEMHQVLGRKTILYSNLNTRMLNLVKLGLLEKDGKRNGKNQKYKLSARFESVVESDIITINFNTGVEYSSIIRL